MYYNQYTPQMMSPQMTSPQAFTPQMASEMGVPQMMTPQMAPQQMMAPQMAAPSMVSPQMMNNNMMYMTQGNNVMQEMQREELKMMYPKSYYLIMPHVKHHCDMLESKHGSTYCPTRVELEEIKDEIYKCIDKSLDDCEEDDYEKHHHHDRSEYEDESQEEIRQRRYGRNRAVRDLIGVALVSELLGRQPFIPYAPFVPYYPVYPPYGYGYGYGGFY